MRGGDHSEKHEGITITLPRSRADYLEAPLDLVRGFLIVPLYRILRYPHLMGRDIAKR